MSQLSESKVKILIVSIIFLFICQELLTVSRYIGQPYPALKMPGFRGNAINDNGYYEITSMDIKIYFSNESAIEITPKIFFSQAPISHLGHLKKKFHPVANPAEVINPPKALEPFKPIFPGYFVRYRSDYDVQNDPKTVKWLLNRIKEIEPDKNPIRIDFIRYKHLYDPKNLKALNREFIGKSTIEL